MTFFSEERVLFSLNFLTAYGAITIEIASGKIKTRLAILKITENLPINSSVLKVLSIQIKYVPVSKRKQISGNINQFDNRFLNFLMLKFL